MCMHFPLQQLPRTAIALSTLLGLGSFLGACAPMQTNQAQAQPETVKLVCDLPELVPLDQTKNYLSHGGVGISVTPGTYNCAQTTDLKINKSAPTISEALAGSLSGQDKDHVFVEQVSTPAMEVKPKNISFLLKVNNKLDHVFRGAGALVEMNVANQMIPVDRSNYVQLSNAMIAPRSEQDIRIEGPSVSNLADGATVGLFLDDVVSKTDAAGNPTKREHFEWFFKVSHKHHETVAQVERKRGWMDERVLLQQQMSEQMRQQQMQIMQQVQLMQQSPASQ